jgi:hypothetical protein
LVWRSIIPVRGWRGFLAHSRHCYFLLDLRNTVMTTRVIIPNKPHFDIGASYQISKNVIEQDTGRRGDATSPLRRSIDLNQLKGNLQRGSTRC